MSETIYAWKRRRDKVFREILDFAVEVERQAHRDAVARGMPVGVAVVFSARRSGALTETVGRKAWLDANPPPRQERK